MSIADERSDPLPLQPRRRAGALLTGADIPGGATLAEFAQEIAGRGFSVGGIVQITHRDEAGRKIGMDFVELDTGRRLAVHQPLGPGAGESCTIDPFAVTEATEALRRAIERRCDLIIVNKFSQLEAAGRGFSDEIAKAMAEGLPLLTVVPREHLGDWLTRSGGDTDLLPPTREALWRWWGAYPLYRDLIGDVPEVPVKRIVVGLNWTLVESETGVGIAQTPSRDTEGCRAVLGDPAGKNLRDLARLAVSSRPFETALGLAAINAHYNRPGLEGSAANGLDLLAEAAARGARLVSIGRFPDLARRLPGIAIVEREPKEGEYPESAAAALLSRCEGAILTASTLVNRTAPALIEAGRGAELILVGPGTPLSPRLYDYGIAALSGLVIEDAEGAARAVASGCATKPLKAFGRTVTLGVGRDRKS